MFYYILCPWFFCIFAWLWWWCWSGFGAAHWCFFVLFEVKVLLFGGISILGGAVGPTK
jgi:hypothetical protein